MYKLVGETFGHDLHELALFHKEDDALTYIEHSRLKLPKPGNCQIDLFPNW